MPGILYVVATPIGNLEDVTLRALRILREVTLIAAEDTRRTAKLLQHYSISTPTTSLHEHNEHARTPQLIDRLSRGDSIALVSDAGTPGISDPGATLVAAAHRAGIAVQPVPGPSALTAAISAAGLTAEGFVFVGFPPSRSTHRKKWTQELAEESRPIVLYEAPHRILATLHDLYESLGDRNVLIGREVSKKHETLAVRPISDWISNPPAERGEFVLVISAPEISEGRDREVPTDEVLADHFWHLTNNVGLSRREALRQVASKHGVSSRAVFAAVESLKKSVD